MRRVLLTVLIAAAVTLGGAGCAPSTSGPLEAYTPTTGVSCELMAPSREFAVVDAYVNTSSSPVTITTAQFASTTHMNVMGGPWAYPGRQASFRLLSYPFDRDPLFDAARAAWPKRVKLAGLSLPGSGVVYIAFLTKVAQHSSSGALGPYRVSYQQSGQTYIADGAFTYEVAARRC